MSEQKIIKLDYLKEQEIIDLYELFFGKILVKKPDFSYVNSLTQFLLKENSLNAIFSRINQYEVEILKTLSKNVFVPYKFIVEKLNIVLNIPSQIINKSISTLLMKKYIFLRNNEILVVPGIYNSSKEQKIEYSISNEINNKIYMPKLLIDINNLINYFISYEIKFSNSNALYKKDFIPLEQCFATYSSLKRIEYNLVSYFFRIAFLDDNYKLKIDKLKFYFSQNSIKKALYFLEITFPAIYAILKTFYLEKKSIIITTENFKNLWINSFFLNEYQYVPFKYNFSNILNLLIQLELVKEINNNNLLILYYNDDNSYISNDNISISSNFNFYINADSSAFDFYLPALFANLVKYNKIVEYEITEFSIRRSIINGLNFSDLIEYFKKLNLTLSPNVETTIKQWFEKHGSYYYTSGTLFFCEGNEKGKLILNLINNKIIKAYEIKKDEVFLIPEEEKNNFFSFLDKSGITYYFKEPQKTVIENDNREYVDLSFLLVKI